MKLTKLCGAGLLLAGLLFPSDAEARSRRYYERNHFAAPYFGGYGFGMVNHCCAPPVDVCAPMHGCGDPCAQPVMMQSMQPVYQTQMRPVMQTTLQPQQVVTYQQVPQIQYQRQAYVEQVPVTVYQPQVRYRDVAVQVNQVVAQTQTQMIPRQTVQYVPETRMIGMQPGGSQIVGWQTGYTGMAGMQYGIPQYGMQTYYGTQFGYGVSPYGVPMSASLPAFTLPGEPVPEAAGLDRLAPQPQDAQTPGVDSNWSTIKQRTALEPADNTSYLPSSRGHIIPTAATVWSSRAGGR